MLNPFYPNTNIAILFQNLQKTHRYRESAREWIGLGGIILLAGVGETDKIEFESCSEL